MLMDSRLSAHGMAQFSLGLTLPLQLAVFVLPVRRARLAVLRFFDGYVNFLMGQQS
jgi:hypothetical protein